MNLFHYNELDVLDVIHKLNFFTIQSDDLKAITACLINIYCTFKNKTFKQ